MHTEKVQDAHQEGVRCKVQDAHWEGALAARHSAGKDPALPALTLLWSKGFHWSGSFVKGVTKRTNVADYFTSSSSFHRLP